MKASSILAALRRPISTRFRVRWSTVVMTVLFVGLGSLWLEVKTSPSTAANTAKAIDQVGRGLAPGESITITHGGTTTTTVPSTTTVSPRHPVPPTSLAPSATTSPTHPTDTTPSPTTGPHHNSTTSTSVPGVENGTSTTTLPSQTSTSSPG